jgi:hypothetical protein
MSTNDQIEQLKRAFRENNDWFYDKPEVGKLNDKASEYAGMYFRLASKWLILNNAFTSALALIEEQRDTINNLTTVIDSLKQETK